MIMTEYEIRREYRLAKYPNRQIKILAQLNACRAKEIRKIVADEENISGFGRYVKATEEDKMRLYSMGLSDYSIAEKLGTSATTILKWRRKNNLPHNRRKK